MLIMAILTCSMLSTLNHVFHRNDLENNQHSTSLSHKSKNHVLYRKNSSAKCRSIFPIYTHCVRAENYKTSSQVVFSERVEKNENLIGSNKDLRALCKEGRLNEAIQSLHLMDQDCIRRDPSVYGLLLKGCANNRALREGKEVHSHIIKIGIKSDRALENRLLNMYAKCGNVGDARLVFEKMSGRGVVSWTAMISCYVQNGEGDTALELFCQMLRAGVEPNQFTFGSVVASCTGTEFIEQGKQVCALAIKSGYASDVHVGSSLVAMYAKCGNMEDARQMFDRMPERNMVSWTGMIASYVQNEDTEEALHVFREMRQEGVMSDSFTLASVLCACANLEALHEGRQVHAEITKIGIERDLWVGTALIDMYAKCSEATGMADARKLFDRLHQQNVVTWTAIIAGYAQSSVEVEEAFKLFLQMKWADVKPNPFTFTAVIKVCASLADLKSGKQICAHIVKAGLETELGVANSIITMYARCGSIEDARKMFDKMLEKNLVSWNSMLAGYVQTGHSEEAYKLFHQKHVEGEKTDAYTFTSILSACAIQATLEQGIQVHTIIVKTGFESDISVGNALLTMYARCGNIDDACKIFNKILEPNVISWTAIITGYAQHGQGKEALKLFEQMHGAGVQPNHITFIAVLSACSYVGLVDEGHRYFLSMSNDHGILPSLEHYACMVDLLGRAGYLEKAEALICEMPFKPDALVWRTLLGSCIIHGNIDLGKRAAKCLLELEPQDASTYVLLSNMHAVAGEWDDVTRIRKMMKDRQLRKEAGCSWIEIKNKVHTFFVRDMSHPLTKEIYAKLEELSVQMKEMGYVPDTNFVLHDVEDEQKEQFLCHHSEKLAISFGLLVTPNGTRLRIFKNLRVCGDCHTVIKYVAQIVEREIVVRDTNRFHHFKDGLCSCGDYW